MPQRIDFGQGKARTMPGTMPAITSSAGAARLLDDGDVEIALLVRLDLRLGDRGEPGRLEEAVDGAARRTNTRSLPLLPPVRRARRQTVHGERQAPRRHEGLGALIDQPSLDQRIGNELAQILRRLPLHAGGNFFGEEFEEKVGHRSVRAAFRGDRSIGRKPSSASLAPKGWGERRGRRIRNLRAIVCWGATNTRGKGKCPETPKS